MKCKREKKEKYYLIYSVVQSAHMAEILRDIVKSTMRIYAWEYILTLKAINNKTNIVSKNYEIEAIS